MEIHAEHCGMLNQGQRLHSCVRDVHFWLAGLHSVVAELGGSRVGMVFRQQEMRTGDLVRHF